MPSNTENSDSFLPSDSLGSNRTLSFAILWISPEFDVFGKRILTEHSVKDRNAPENNRQDLIWVHYWFDGFKLGNIVLRSFSVNYYQPFPSLDFFFQIYSVGQIYTLLINQNIVFHFWDMRKIFHNVNFHISLISRDRDMKISAHFWMCQKREKAIFLREPKTYRSSCSSVRFYEFLCITFFVLASVRTFVT